jgi:hypothetical protein
MFGEHSCACHSRRLHSVSRIALLFRSYADSGKAPSEVNRTNSSRVQAAGSTRYLGSHLPSGNLKSAGSTRSPRSSDFIPQA